VRDYSTSPNLFEIIGPDNTYKVFCAGPQEKESWMNDLLEHIYGGLDSKSDENNRIGEFAYLDGGNYKGSFFNGMRGGIGEYVFYTQKYEGEWKDNLKHGVGTMYYVDGSSYKGDWSYDRQDGKGVLQDDLGNTYEGEWKSGKKQGKGKVIYQNGDYYEGIWENDAMNGMGVLVLKNGIKYKGQFQDNKFHGDGKLKSLGKIYKGTFENGQRHGKGILTYNDGRVYDGDWQKDKRHGQGRYDCSKMDGTVYIGAWAEGKKGPGKMIYADGSYYEGHWKDNKRHGRGIFIYKTGIYAEYTGLWHYNKQHGEGSLRWVNGKRFEGSFNTGKPSGYGVLTFANGVSISCKWDRGRPTEGKCTITLLDNSKGEERKSILKSFLLSNTKNNVIEGDINNLTINLGNGPYNSPKLFPLAPTIPQFDYPQHPAAREYPY